MRINIYFCKNFYFPVFDESFLILLKFIFDTLREYYFRTLYKIHQCLCVVESTFIHFFFPIYTILKNKIKKTQCAVTYIRSVEVENDSVDGQRGFSTSLNITEYPLHVVHSTWYTSMINFCFLNCESDWHFLTEIELTWNRIKTKNI